ncbi:hypothetical protein F511_24425 [Dorcoceras hygrometricum]|uniref:Uncharacterized protein n=1 Tax=Dorcoceras hygrometricum TaxID=472368 RepID=A0A2Z7CSB0_9LAMI|nr:hypothetical protein F511_24425 [Dorcoceras hygrometricum]
MHKLSYELRAVMGVICWYAQDVSGSVPCCLSKLVSALRSELIWGHCRRNLLGAWSVEHMMLDTRAGLYVHVEMYTGLVFSRSPMMGQSALSWGTTVGNHSSRPMFLYQFKFGWRPDEGITEELRELWFTIAGQLELQFRLELPEELRELGFTIAGQIELQFRLELPFWFSHELLPLKLLAEA